MKVHVTCRRIRLSPDVRSFLEEKLHRLARYLGDADEVHVVASTEKRGVAVEIVVSGPDGHFVGAARAEEPRAATLEAIDHLSRQLRREQRRRTDRRRRAGRSGRPRVPAGSAGGQDGRPSHPRVLAVRRERLSAEPLSVEEATHDLFASPEPFLVFLNAETGRMSVVYRRRDGRVGLIEAD